MSQIRAALRSSHSFSGRTAKDRALQEDIAGAKSDSPSPPSSSTVRRRMWFSSKKYSLSAAESEPVQNGLSKEENALQEFKNRTKDIIQPHHDDYYLTKWLKARGFEVKKAEEMFRASMKFREKHKVDDILDSYQPPKVLQEYLTGGFCGFDKEGSPVRVELFGYLDMKGIMYSARRESLEKTKLFQCETTVRDWKRQGAKLGRRVDGLTVIFDMDNVGTKSLWRPGLQMYLHLVKVLEDNYPEMMKRMFVINAPRIFPLLWKICRPLISEDMKTKIHVLGADYPTVLLRYIDADQLPAFLGGKLTDPDGNPRCISQICQGGEVPRTYYLSEAADTESMETIVVPKGDKRRVEVDVPNPNTILRYEFMTEDYDISFGIVRKDIDGTETELLAPARVACHMIPEDGSIVCPVAGKYVLVFDNTYSWTRGKKLLYSVEQLTTDSDTQAEVDQVSGGCFANVIKSTRL